MEVQESGANYILWTLTL